MRKVWETPGGVHPPENKIQSVCLPIGNIALPDHLVIPLNQHIGAEAIPLVAIGDHVLKGQKIAEAQGLISAPAHASTSGIVRQVGPHKIPHASGMEANCIVIESDGKDQWCELESLDDFHSLNKKQLLEKIRDAGIAGMGGAGFPAAVKLNPRADQKIDTLILNGTECEPYITADDMLMRERADEIIEGMLLLAQLLDHPSNLIIGIEDNKPQAINAMKKAALDTTIEIVSFPTKYPSGGEKQLIQILTGKEVPSGGIPAALGIVVQNVGTAVAAYRAVKFGEPLISRVTTIVGESVGQQRNIEVLIGTPIDHVLQEHSFDSDNCARLIIGGPMMGFAINDTSVPVIKTTNCILVPSKEEMPEPAPAQACIRCGMCAEACPAQLLPQQLYWFSQSEDVDKLKSHNLFDCIECGACSFVCPSNIPLVQYYRASKGKIRQIEVDKVKSDRSRERFENRKLRIAKAEGEKEAKRQARKKAAEAAKQKLASQKAKPGSIPKADNIIENAIKRAEDAPVDPATQRAKLARAHSSAQSRVERASEQLNQAKEENLENQRIETLAARLKQAEQKFADAETKLSEFDASSATQESDTTSTNDLGEKSIKEKIALSDNEKQEKTIETLKKRLATAEEKYSEAEQSGSSTADALKQGVAKLRKKLEEANSSLASMPADTNARQEKPGSSASSVSAADLAIEKAKQKAEAMAKMSDEEKTQAQIDSLKSRLLKAKERLEKAEQEQSEHIGAFKSSVEKLEHKLQQMQENV